MTKRKQPTQAAPTAPHRVLTEAEIRVYQRLAEGLPPDGFESKWVTKATGWKRQRAAKECRKDRLSTKAERTRAEREQPFDYRGQAIQTRGAISNL